MDRTPGWINRVSEKEFVTHTLTKLRSLKDDYVDELPTEIVHSTSRPSNYKCRAAWWGMLGMRVRSLKDRELLSEDIIRDYNLLAGNYMDHMKHRGSLTTAEDISSANSFLTGLIGSLQSRLP
tara:strand:- start:455 stop:823 length:369 start_codon:yes stop_codon:yes gene_type:complete